jgi:hypothetical protein
MIYALGLYGGGSATRATCLNQFAIAERNANG